MEIDENLNIDFFRDDNTFPIGKVKRIKHRGIKNNFCGNAYSSVFSLAIPYGVTLRHYYVNFPSRTNLYTCSSYPVGICL